MENFITVLTFTYPYEAAIIRGRLESEGVECFLKDEFTVQVNPFYSNAVGGVKLQVKESDLEKVVEILRDGGYIKDENEVPSKIYQKIDVATLKLPFIKKLKFEFRLLIIIIFVSLVIGLIIYFIQLPTTYERLTENNWCLDYAYFDGKYQTPETIAIFKATWEGQCSEVINFRKNGRLLAPGFQTQKVNGQWNIEGKFLNISKTDTLQFVYNGFYKMEFTDETLTLTSEKTVIYCHANRYQFSF